MRSAQAVCARVAAANDHHAFAGCMNCTNVIQKKNPGGVALATMILLRQKLHRKVNALELAAFDGQIAWILRAAAQKNRVAFILQRLDRYVHANIRIALERNAFILHLLDAAIENMFLKLEVRNAVAHQSAEAVVLLVNSY